MPIFMCQALAKMKSSRITAIGSEPRICAAPAWLRPSSIITITITGIISSVMATAVMRWRQKSDVPECAAPRLRTRPSGVRMEERFGEPWDSSKLIVRLRSRRR